MQLWGKFFSHVDKFSSEHELMVSTAVIKQKVLALLCHNLTVEFKEGTKREGREGGGGRGCMVILVPGNRFGPASQSEQVVAALSVAGEFCDQHIPSSPHLRRA